MEVRAEADFYGSMDGASKFVRGDAVAGILILFINIIGGLAIGMIGHGMSFGEAGRTFTLLTIGDGLVTQIPALLLSTSVAIIVTRMSGKQDMGGELTRQLFGQPRALGVAAGLLGVMGLIPGMPNLAFLTIASLSGGASYIIRNRKAAAAAAAAQPRPVTPTAPEALELSWDDVRPVDSLGLEVGYRLLPLVNRSSTGGDLLGRIRGVRRKLSQELGFLVPSVHIRDNLDLPPNSYRINLGGVPVGESLIYPERELAINPGRVFGQLKGIATHDPAFGMEAVWIEPEQRDHAQSLGYTVVDASTVIATHLSHIVQLHAHELLGHEEVQHLLAGLSQECPEVGRRFSAAGTGAGRGGACTTIAARRARSYSQSAHHYRNIGRTCLTQPRSVGAAGSRAHRLIAPNRSGHCRYERRDSGHDPRRRVGASAARLVGREWWQHTRARTGSSRAPATAPQ